ncbi:Protein SRV-14, partial [Aphelenchoides avenae]
MRYDVNTDGCLIPRIVSKDATNRYWTVAMGFLFLNTAFVTTLYAVIFAKIRRRNLRRTKDPVDDHPRSLTQRQKRLEIRLITMSSIVCLVQVVLVAFCIVKLLKLFEMPLELFYLVYNLLSDVYSGINPYLLWIFSPPLRKQALTFLGFNAAKHPVIVATTSSVRRKWSAPRKCSAP